MKKYACLCVFFLMAAGCATIAETSRATRFDTAFRAFEKAMKTSDFESALEHADPEGIQENADPDRFKDVKIASYRVKKREMSDDGRNVTETIRVEYYHANNTILRTLQHDQVWKYKDEMETWLLQTALPAFP